MKKTEHETQNAYRLSLQKCLQNRCQLQTHASYCKKEKLRCANCPPQVWWTRRDSNPRLLQCECSTLPTELRALIWRKCAYNKFSILLIKCFVNQAKTSAERGRTGVFCSFNRSCRKTHFTSSCCFIFQLK